MAGTSMERAPLVGDVPESIHKDAAGGEVGADVELAAHGHLVSYNPDAPSEEWGWHGSWRDFAPLGTRILLWIGVAVMFVMLIGNHVSHVEDYYLIGTGLLLAFWLLRSEASKRKERRRRP